jgi:hypothetical protein
MIEKLTADLRTASGIITIMVRCLLGSVPNSALLDNPTIAELLPNVREIGRRADVLAGQITDPTLAAIIDAQRNLANICVKVVTEGRGPRIALPIDEITAAAAKAQKTWSKIPKQKRDDGERPEERQPPRRKSGTGTDVMTPDDFFRMLDQIKRAEGGRAPEGDQGDVAVVEWLIDF